MTSIFRKIRVKWQIWRGQAIDIWSKNAYPADVLSNLCSNGFRFDGVVCGSMEGFLQSLKQQDINKQRQICSMKGKKSKETDFDRMANRPDSMVEGKGYRPTERRIHSSCPRSL